MNSLFFAATPRNEARRARRSVPPADSFESKSPETCRSFASFIRWILGCCALIASPVFAQWTTHALPANGRIVAVMDTDTPSGKALFATGTVNYIDYVFYASFDDGATWQPRSIPGYPSPVVIWAGTRPKSDGLPSLSGDLYMTIRVPGSSLVESCDILRSADLGATWSVVARSAPACRLAFDPTAPERVFGSGNGEATLFMALIYRSSTGGATWEWLDTKLNSARGSLRVGADGTLYSLGAPMAVSLDHGDFWTQSSIPPVEGTTTIATDLLTWRHPVYGSHFAVTATTTGLYPTTDAGASWQASGLQRFSPVALAHAGIPGAQASDVIVGFRDGLTLMTDAGLIPFANGLPIAGDYYEPIGGPYVASSASVWRCANLASCKGGSLPAAATLVEFHNTILDHYFMTAEPAEATGIDSGTAGPGWTRTGYAYLVFANPGGTPDAQPVCRFYGTPGRGPNSHFFTLDAQECAAVGADPGWALETAMAFAVAAPIARVSFPAGITTYDCGNRRPVYRLYNNRYAQNDSNHRYTSDLTVYQAMQVRGWTGEGVRFCVPG
jgi:hypothetical protein